jgi:hypothetical protein
MIFVAILGVAKIHPHDPESFWRTRPVTFRQMFSAWAILLGAFGVFWCWLFPVALALVMELPLSAALQWCVLRSQIFVFVIPFLLAAVPYPFRDGDIGRRLSWAVPPLGAYLLSVFWFLDTEIQLPGEFLPWGGALVTALFGLSAIAIVVRVFLLRKNNFALAFAASVWGVAVAGAIGIAWKSEVIFAYQEKSLPESPLAITLEKPYKEDPSVSDRDYWENFKLIPSQKNTDGTAWAFIGHNPNSDSYRIRDKEPSPSFLLPGILHSMGLQMPTLKDEPQLYTVSLGGKEKKKKRIYLEQFRFVKLAEFPLEEESVHKNGNGMLWTQGFERTFNYRTKEYDGNGQDDHFWTGRLRHIQINSQKASFIVYWDPKTKSVLSLVYLSPVERQESSWFGLRRWQFWRISVTRTYAPHYRPKATDLYSGVPVPGSMITIFATESTGKRAVKTFVREEEGKPWQEKK